MKLKVAPFVLIALYTVVGVLPSGYAQQSVTVNFTLVPRAGAGPADEGDIAGRATGLDSWEDYRIVLYARTDRWYVQPLVDDPFTLINADGSWSNWTHLGRRYAAVLVRSSFRPQARSQTLPPIGGDVIARAETPAFSGDR